MDGDRGDLAHFGKNATQKMIFIPHYLWAENNKYLAMYGTKDEHFFFIYCQYIYLQYIFYIPGGRGAGRKLISRGAGIMS